MSRAGTQLREGLTARGTAWRSRRDAGQKQLERQTFGKAGRTADMELGLCKVRAEASPIFLVSAGQYKQHSAAGLE